MDEHRSNILEFPCEFPLRVIGEDAGDFAEFVLEIVRRHVPELDDRSVSSQPSTNGRFKSIRMQFTAQDRQQVDALYTELSSHSRIRFIL